MPRAQTHAYKPIAQMTRAEIVDELKLLEDWYDENKPRLDRRTKLREVIRGGGEKKLVGWAELDNKPATEPVQYDGAKSQVQLGARADVSSIASVEKVWKRVGSTRFLQACTLTLKAARGLLPTADEDGTIVTEPASGSREILAVVDRTARRAA